MPEEKRHNPFEQHIESESFDVSGLGRELSRANALEQEVQDFLERLPQPLDYELWDSELDERQKLLCVHLTNELVERVIRTQHNEHVDHLTDDELIHMLMVPMTVAMLAEREFNPPPQPIVPASPPPPTTPAWRERLERLELGRRVNDVVYQVRERMSKIYFRILERRKRY